MSKVYTAEEVCKHNHEKDLWIVYEDGVYDITKFLKEHPGGVEVLINLAGKDATACFDDIGHTPEAIQLRETYKIGTVSGPLTAAPVSGGTQDTTINDNSKYEPPKEVSLIWYPVFIAAVAVIYAYMFWYFWFS